MENIFIITNFWIFLEEFQASNFENPTYISFSEDYCKNFSKEDIDDLKKTISNIIGNYILLDEKDVFKMNFNKVYMSSGTPLYGEGIYKQELKCKEYIFVEDGGYDYSSTQITSLVEIRKKSTIFVFDKMKFKMSEYYKETKELDIEVSINIIKENIEDDIFNLDKKLPILFTAPIEVQNIEKIEKTILSFDKIIIKQHPRDSRNFKIFEKYTNVVICKKIIPGQILDVLFNGEKFYEYSNATICIEKDQLEKIRKGQ